MGPQLPQASYSRAISGTFQFVSATAAPGRSPLLRYANSHVSFFIIQGDSKESNKKRQTYPVFNKKQK